MVLLHLSDQSKSEFVITAEFPPPVVGSIASCLTALLKLLVSEDLHAEDLSVESHGLRPRAGHLEHPVKGLSSGHYFWKK